MRVRNVNTTKGANIQRTVVRQGNLETNRKYMGGGGLLLKKGHNQEMTVKS